MPSEYTSATDLPPEITARIVELLSGRQPDTWERNSLETCPPLELSKRELGRCSLVCKFWAGFLRRDIFRRLALRTLEDGDQFCSFITSPSPGAESSVARLVQRLDLYYDLAGPPWVHRIFVSRCKLDQRVETYVTVSDSSDSLSPVLVRSIYHSLPRSLPPQMTHIKGLSLLGLSFSDPSSLRKFLISVDLPSWPKIAFHNVHVKDTGMFPSQHCRSIMFATLRVRDGRAPLRILRSCSTSNWAQTDRPQPPTLAVLERVLFAIMRTCPVTAAWASTEAGERNAVEIEAAHQHDRAFDCELMHDSTSVVPFYTQAEV